jgi:hypothetical protein
MEEHGNESRAKMYEADALVQQVVSLANPSRPVSVQNIKAQQAQQLKFAIANVCRGGEGVGGWRRWMGSCSLSLSPLPSLSSLSSLSLSPNYQLPTTNYQLPTTNYQLPTTNYQLPTTNYQLPTINYQLSLSLSLSLSHNF